MAPPDPFILPHLDRDRILDFYRKAGGNEIESGKLGSNQSSAALVANFFGYFIDRPGDFPGLPGLALSRVDSVLPEQCLRFPWVRGRHPWLDAVVMAADSFVAIESKRYEPFRSHKPAAFADVYFSHRWGDGLLGFTAMRDRLHGKTIFFRHLDAAQLVKHAFGLATELDRPVNAGRGPVLYYLYAEPDAWPDGKPILADAHRAHRAEVEIFADIVSGGSIRFAAGTWRDLLALAQKSDDPRIVAHASGVSGAFAPL